MDQLSSPDQSSGITLTELNEKEVAQPLQDSNPESSAGVVKRRISRTEKEKVQCNGGSGFIDYVHDYETVVSLVVSSGFCSTV